MGSGAVFTTSEMIVGNNTMLSIVQSMDTPTRTTQSESMKRTRVVLVGWSGVGVECHTVMSNGMVL